TGQYSRRDVFAISGAAVLGSAAAMNLTSQLGLAQEATPTPDQLRAPEPDPQRGGVVRTAWGATTAHYDLHQGASSAVLANVYDLLVMKNLADGLRTIIPGLATSWEIADDGLTYTFTLREGVTFHDGEPFTADDVVATFSRILFPPEGMVSVYRSELGPVESVTALDPTTVEFVLSSPWPVFLEVLTNPALVIYSQKSLEENNQDLRRDIAPGTGPFVVTEALAGEKFVFARNEAYWNPELPYIDGIEMLHVPVWTDRGTAVLTGQANLSFNVSPETWEEGATREDIGTARLPCLNSHTAIINNEHEPFNDPRVRRAIHLAVSKQNLIAAISATQEPVFLTTWMPVVAPYAPTAEELATRPGYRPEKEEDIAEAKRLMAEAGYPDGFGPVDLVTASDPQHSGINGPAVQEELRRSLGIESEIRLVERGLLSELYQSGDFDIIVEGAFTSNLVDPTLLWNANLRTGASTNWSRYANEEFDAILDQIVAESDEAVRQELFDQGVAILDDDPPFLMIGFCAHSAMWHDSVKGLALEDRLFSQFGRFETVWLDQ
ncbi:MAG: ABC transporter substrate-binding protein, partial [Chloroflexota bacterium]|nr:ABC transporter substrate-binding protein [Chloroflexota bacterium]